MTNIKSSKYASLFINKTFNNFLWKNVIYDSNCNDSFTYDLNRFVNEITFVHELIDILTIRWWSKNMKSCSWQITLTTRIEKCSSKRSRICRLLMLFWCS
jgi:hypothetical protein